jgi:hypothetical protein
MGWNHPKPIDELHHFIFFKMVSYCTTNQDIIIYIYIYMFLKMVKTTNQDIVYIYEL